MDVTLTTYATIDKKIVYTVAVAGKDFCWTTNDDEGLALGIAIARLQLQRDMERTGNNFPVGYAHGKAL